MLLHGLRRLAHLLAAMGSPPVVVSQPTDNCQLLTMQQSWVRSRVRVSVRALQQLRAAACCQQHTNLPNHLLQRSAPLAAILPCAAIFAMLHASTRTNHA